MHRHFAQRNTFARRTASVAFLSWETPHVSQFIPMQLKHEQRPLSLCFDGATYSARLAQRRFSDCDILFFLYFFLTSFNKARCISADSADFPVAFLGRWCTMIPRIYFAFHRTIRLFTFQTWTHIVNCIYSNTFRPMFTIWLFICIFKAQRASVKFTHTLFTYFYFCATKTVYKTFPIHRIFTRRLKTQNV